MAGRACSQPARPVTFGQGCVSSCHVASTKRTCFGENEGREKVGGRSTGSHLGAGSGASELKGFLFFTCLHVFKKKKQQKTTQGIVLKCHHASVHWRPCISILAALQGDVEFTLGRVLTAVAQVLITGSGLPHLLATAAAPHPHLSWLHVAGLWPQPAVRNLFLIELIF